MEDVRNSSLVGRSQNPSFTRAFNDQGVDIVERFLLSIWEDSARNEEDKVLWTETKSNKFTIKSLYNALETGISVFFPMKIIWNPWVQPKVSFFAWKATWEKAPTLD